MCSKEKNDAEKSHFCGPTKKIGDFSVPANVIVDS